MRELQPPDTSDIQFLDWNATLAIKQAQFSDTGRYKFTRPSGKSIQSDKSGKEFDLKVVACDQLARGPFPLAPLPCGVTSLKVGDHVTIPRTGYFGCDQPMLAIIAPDDRITQTQIDTIPGNPIPCESCNTIGDCGVHFGTNINRRQKGVVVIRRDLVGSNKVPEPRDFFGYVWDNRM
ncbi:hypothetical protein DPMN_002223 [Dreissena polymorpha]|uniref:Uncharacterized protein n=1 Tax=Dreissena polymorpha TaxID=45954 RepID=A0A9D4MLK5_DREPO|nr:hypothetical protein DPMN_002223 [Dreissena polymorpha]